MENRPELNRCIFWLKMVNFIFLDIFFNFQHSQWGRFQPPMLPPRSSNPIFPPARHWKLSPRFRFRSLNETTRFRAASTVPVPLVRKTRHRRVVVKKGKRWEWHWELLGGMKHCDVPHLPVPYISGESGVDCYLIYWQLGTWFQICKDQCVVFSSLYHGIYWDESFGMMNLFDQCGIRIFVSPRYTHGMPLTYFDIRKLSRP